MDLDLDGPSKVPTRQSRFAPKNSKLKPQPKTETLPPTDSAKKEELNSQLPLTDHITENGAAKVKEDNVATVKEDNVAIFKDDAPLDGETTGDDLVEEQFMTEGDSNDDDEVVREIDVWYTPSFDPVSKVGFDRFNLRLFIY